MDIILVSENKLKITLTSEDLDYYGVSADELNYKDSGTKGIIDDILERAKADVGFEHHSKKILVQLYPSKKGGCEIYITGLGGQSTDVCDPQKAKYCDLEEENKSNKKDDLTVISFSSCEDMIGFCRRVALCTHKYTSKAYANAKSRGGVEERFVLMLLGSSSGEEKNISPLLFAQEYGKIENSDLYSKIIDERYSPVFSENAVENLSVF